MFIYIHIHIHISLYRDIYFICVYIYICMYVCIYIYMNRAEAAGLAAVLLLAAAALRGSVLR